MFFCALTLVSLLLPLVNIKVTVEPALFLEMPQVLEGLPLLRHRPAACYTPPPSPCPTPASFPLRLDQSQVAVEPALPSEMPQLLEGLRLLNRADPFVEISVMPTGEHVLGAAGEVSGGRAFDAAEEVRRVGRGSGERYVLGAEEEVRGLGSERRKGGGQWER